MNRIVFVLVTLCLGLAFLSSQAQADTWNKKTRVTFTQPVQVPGVALPAGTYVFKLADSHDRNIVQITNERGDEVYATILAIAEHRHRPTDHTVITFDEEAVACVPTPVKSWFYPGDKRGRSFVYSNEQAMRRATACHEPVPGLMNDLPSEN
jgi:hypothetical protein